MPPCPWDGLRPAVMHFCEASRCALVAQPGNTASSAAFALAGAALLATATPAERPMSRWFAAAALFVGLGSALYHATAAFVFELVDLASMFVLAALMLAASLAAARGWSARRALGALLGLALASVAATLASIDLGNALFGAQLVAAVGLEAVAARRARVVPRRLLAAVALFAAAYLLWNLDYYRIACDPENAVLNGHAAWHVLTAAALLALGLHYRRRTAFAAPGAGFAGFRAGGTS